jgi:hypothetical protein
VYTLTLLQLWLNLGAVRLNAGGVSRDPQVMLTLVAFTCAKSRSTGNHWLTIGDHCLTIGEQTRSIDWQHSNSLTLLLVLS